MSELLSGAFSAVAGALSGVWGYVLAAGLSLAVGAYGGYRFELGAYEAQVAAQAQGQVKAAQDVTATVTKQDAVSLNFAAADATAQLHIASQADAISKEIDTHVSNDAHCITFGLVRVLNAAADGRDEAIVPIPAAQPDDACAPVSWRALAADITDDYRAGLANDQQLSDLQAWVNNEAAADNGTPAPGLNDIH